MSVYTVNPQSSAGTGRYVWKWRDAPQAASLLRDIVNPGFTPVRNVRFEIQWDQLYAVTVAIESMAERAREGCAAAANWAARKTRENLIDATAEHSTLPHERIEQAVEVAAKADEAHPAAMVRVNPEPAPLYLFQNRADAGGIFVTTDPTKGDRYIPDGFYASGSLSEGIYQRAMQNGHRAGRLPIEEQFGPSVVSTLQAGLLTQQIDGARQELTFAVMRARDIVISDLPEKFAPRITEDDPRMNYSSWSKSAADFEDHSLTARIAERLFSQ